MQIASQKYDHFYFNCSGEHSYKNELKNSKDFRTDKIVEFTEYFLSFELLDLDHRKISAELNFH
ncbi:hypothetical protein [Prochlorococcus marinus]|uniref:Uncharacterized protein n=1 Tax=Prochlorococcus marinus str. P0902-H212 TaxID=1620696 RepID=A0A0D5A3M1_PROMR|nr:hypothetical protein [Prochlorococcus marinus]AJW30773.1 hypothetical protein FA02_0510 [Prochlorococcus marinus str. P0902-H212]